MNMRQEPQVQSTEIVIKRKRLANNVSNRKVFLRQTSVKDFDSIINIVKKTYPDMSNYSKKALTAHLNHFPEGQFVVEYDHKVVGFCITFIISESIAMETHTWKEITGSSFASRHDPLGDILYGMEVCVDPDYRGTKIGQRLYNERKKLCKTRGLKGIIFGARIPGFAEEKKIYPTPEKYLSAIKAKKIKDPTISFQIRNGFEPIKILEDYLPNDVASEGHAVLMRWNNPLIDKHPQKVGHYQEDMQERVRICTINFHQRRLDSFKEFKNIIEYFIDVAAEYNCDFVVFPEFVTMSLLSLENKKLSPMESLERLDRYTNVYIKLMHNAAMRNNINIIGGTHLMRNKKGEMQNVCHVFLRDGSIHTQTKIHPTPSEKNWWDIKGGNELAVINTDKGAIGILICYDSEFPELSRYLVDQGAKIIFIPFATDTKQGYLRVRYCAQARAVENQLYVVLSGNVGNLPKVHNMDINYAQSCILTPSYFPFAPDGIAADTSPNVEMVAIADLSLRDLVQARNSGTVMNLKDRRHDLYNVVWSEKKVKTPS